MMKIDIWSDYVCQYCYIGKRELEAALQQTGLSELVDIEYHAFELSPDAPQEPTLHIFDFLQKLSGKSREEVKQMMADTAERAKLVGLQYNFEDLYHQHTLDAHRIAQFAKSVGLGKELQERLFYAVHTENAFLSDHETLVQLTTEIGLSETKIRAILASKVAFLDEVNQDKAYAAQQGVRGVPFYIINDQYTISGAQPATTFVQLLEKIAKEQNLLPRPPFEGTAKNVCTTNGCE